MIRPGLRAALLVPVAALALAACTSGAASASNSNGRASTPTVGGGLLAKRQSAPVLTGAAIGGGSLSTSAYRGSVVVVNFYASWCAPCAAESPFLEGVARAEPAVKFLGVLFKDSAANGASFRRQYGVTYLSLIDTGGTDIAKFRNVNPSAIPVTFVIDKHGQVAARYIGAISASSGLTAVLDRVKAEQ